MTKRNINGSRHYLEFDDNAKTLSTKCPFITPWSDAIEIKLCDLNRLAFELHNQGYKTVD
jgi:hypothetical protein